jgi:uncharacterized protein (UPF0297 family)
MIIVVVILPGHLIPNNSPTIFLIDGIMDMHYHSIYSSIEKEGNNTINNIVGNTSQHGINSIQLSKIADEIIENFLDSY